MWVTTTALFLLRVVRLPSSCCSTSYLTRLKLILLLTLSLPGLVETIQTKIATKPIAKQAKRLANRAR